jgi:predicted lipoprotein with Yx(FWY)xxD motif
MKSIKNLLFAVTGILCAFFIAGCGKDVVTAPNNVIAPIVPANNIQLITNAKFGSMLADSMGRALYFFATDFNMASNCNGGCAVVWPVFYQPNLVLPKGLNAADFSTITRADGTKQTTYKNWPLYYYKSDVNITDVNGDNVGGTWFVAKPDYTVMLAKGQLTGADGVNYTAQFVAGTGSTLYITDPYGHTLYGFSSDKANTNTYTKLDLSNNSLWPMFEANSKTIPTALDATVFATTTVAGKTQLTYKGWPMYMYGPDNLVKGSNKGVSVGHPGLWLIMNQSTVAAQ